MMKFLTQFFGERRLNLIDLVTIAILLAINVEGPMYWVWFFVIIVTGLVISFNVESALKKQRD